MKVGRVSIISGRLQTMELPVTPRELYNYLSGDMDIQDAFPSLTPAQREFIKSGITPEEWAEHLSSVQEPDGDEEFAEGGAQ